MLGPQSAAFILIILYLEIRIKAIFSNRLPCQSIEGLRRQVLR